MADLLQAIYYTLANTSGVTDITSTRIYGAGDVPEGTALELLTFQLISNMQTRDQGGTSNLDVSRVQFTAVADTTREAYLLKEAVLAVFAAYRGDLGEEGSTVTVRRVLHENDMHIPSPPSDGSQRGPHSWMVDFIFYHVTS